jgi:hypothetical protein
MSGPDIAKIAAGLTTAQREALMWHCPNGGERTNPGAGTGGTMKNLATKGLSTVRYEWFNCGNARRYRRLTPLGLAVRAHLKENTDAAE